MEILTSRVTAVGRHHQEFRQRVFDDVAPVDGVSVAQEFVLVNENAAVQNLCRGMKDKKHKKAREMALQGGYTAHVRHGRKSILQG